ncbi:MAG: hypothetical protein ACKO8Z_12795 [Prosthecobacter sp.]
MKKVLCCLLATAVLSAAGQEVKKFDINCDAWTVGEVPAEVFVLDGKVSIAEKDGGKAIMIDPGTELVEASAQIGDSAAGNALIQARVFASKKGRSSPRFGISVHGMNGPRLYVNPAKKQIELVRGDQLLASAPFVWVSDSWLNLRLEVMKGEGDKWVAKAYAWPDKGQKPTDSLLKHEFTGLKGQGKCTLWATPYSNTPIYFDDLQIEVATVAVK